jgi:predicted O-linked N-acetylglucosamine transferase (SPINDLY family)/predicted SAM-dependent methyltransferase
MEDAAQLQILKQQLKEAPLEPATFELAATCLQRTPTDAVMQPILTAAKTIAEHQRNPQAALPYVHLCQQACPTDRNVLSCLFYLHQQMQQHPESIAIARQIYDLAQTIPEQLYANFLQLRSRLFAGGHWEEVFAIAAQQEQLILTLTEATPVPLDRETALRLLGASFFFPYIRDVLAENRHVQNRLMRLLQASVQSYAQERYARFRQGIATRRTQPRDPNAPLRVGYLSKCLRKHSVGWLSRWVFQYHDRQRVQVYGYLYDYHPDQQDDLQTWFLSHLDQVRTFEQAGLKLADAIFDDAIDILVDLDSATSEHTFEILALKPAPIQVTWLGWDALGLPAADYFIVDPHVLPDDADAHYVEKLWRLPQTYIAVDGFEVGVPTLRREDLGIPDDAIVYWSGQSAYKRHPDCLRSQLRILQAVPGSYFLIKGVEGKESLQQEVVQLATAAGVNPDRLQFLPHAASEFEHRANLAIADVVLDTYPYSGATTTLETLWMGVPLVTRVGQGFSSRNSYTLMLNAGITEGIAWTAEEYVQWGIRLGTDSSLRQQISWKLWRSRQTSPLWNAQQFTRELERMYEQMWANYLQASEPTPSTQNSLNLNRSALKPPETSPAMTPFNLHIGGREKHPDWKILDIEPRPEVDYVGNAADLSQFANNSIDTIYASHVLEHFHYALNDELLKTLREWHRVLKPGGQLMVSVPDLKILCWLYLNPNLEPMERHQLMRIIFGGQTNPYDIHRVGFDADTLGLYFLEAGFQEYERVLEFNLFSDCSQIKILDTLISLNMIARKI